jgi:hypothetical protein
MAMKHTTKQITAELLKELLHYNPDTGIFTWAKSVGQRAQVGRIAGSRTPSGYIKISLSRRLYSAHRLAWLYMKGSWPSHEIDHADNNPSNNAFSNLREATKSQNAQNRGNRRGTTSKYKGVSFDSLHQKWIAQIWIKDAGRCKRIGLYLTEEEAAAAYCMEAKKLHGDFFKVPEYQR